METNAIDTAIEALQNQLNALLLARNEAPPALPTSPDQSGVSELIDNFVRSKLTSREWSEKYAINVTFALKKWHRTMNHGSVGLITTANLLDYRDRLLEMKTKNGTPTSITTVNAHMKYLSQLLEYAVSRDIISRTPATHLKIKSHLSDLSDSERRLPFTPAEAVQVMKLGWLPTIMGYTGARNLEVLQLRKRDVYEVEGILVFDLQTLDAGQRRKTRASRRLIPVHPQLIAEGLLGLLKGDPESPLVPRPINDGDYVKSINRRIRAKIPDPRKTLYSLRHTFRTELADLVSKEANLDRLMGHTQKTIGRRVYTKFDLQTLKDELSKLKYPLN